MMHIGKSTLSAACTETYGLSVMALMRQVRLEQCRMALLKPDRGTTVDTVMRKYRFNNRARFAATYRDAFGELPSAALAKGFGAAKDYGQDLKALRKKRQLGRFRAEHQPLNLALSAALSAIPLLA